MLTSLSHNIFMPTLISLTLLITCPFLAAPGSKDILASDLELNFLL